MKSSSLSGVSHVLVCGGKSCKKDSKGFRKALAKAAEVTGGTVQVLKTSCLGGCENGPVVVVWPRGISFQGAAVSDVPEILAATGWVIPEENGPDTGKPGGSKAKTAENAKEKKRSAKTKKAG
jgi:(2Fe-2S) ferredoxin